MTEQVQTQEPGMRERVEQVLENIRPYIQGDGGDIELVDVTDGVVQIRLAGACVGCMHSMMTLQVGIERMLKEALPEIKAVEAMPF
jgi:Fe-S cluster biogenesis protein NfuA